MDKNTTVELKAKELIEKFMPLVSPRKEEHTGTSLSVSIGESVLKEHAKQCALISINREIEVVNRLLETGLNNDFDLLRERGELQDIRTAIETTNL